MVVDHELRNRIKDKPSLADGVPGLPVLGCDRLRHRRRKAAGSYCARGRFDRYRLGWLGKSLCGQEGQGGGVRFLSDPLQINRIRLYWPAGAVSVNPPGGWFSDIARSD